MAWATRATPGPAADHVRVHPRDEQLVRRRWSTTGTRSAPIPGCRAGFVWDWVDQALVQQLPDGTERLAYGGDFGDVPNDGPFCLNGLVDAERTPHPSLLELAAVIAPVRIRRGRRGPRRACDVTNEHDFVDLVVARRRRWVVEVDGDAVAARASSVPLDVPPGASTELRVPVPSLDLAPGQRAHLTLTFRTRARPAVGPGRSRRRAPAGAMAAAPGPPSAPGPPAQVDRELVLDDLDPTLALWRAPIDNETFGPVLDPHAARWDRLGLRRCGRRSSTWRRTVDDRRGRAARDDPRGRGAGRARRPRPRRRPPPPRSRGAHGRVAGRRSARGLLRPPRESTRFGRWTTAVDDWTVPYVHPQASGNRTGVRWLRFLDADGSRAAHHRRARRARRDRQPLDRRGGGRRRPPRGPPGPRRLLRLDRRPTPRRGIGRGAVPT